MYGNRRQPTGSTKINGTNYIRTLGVVLVLGYHFLPAWLPGGFLGVDIFFTFSGYLITALIIEDFEHNYFSLLQFYKRRLFRLIPVLAGTVLLTLTLSLLISPDFRVDILSQLAAALTFSTNYYEILRGQSYENQLLPRMFVHTWTLAVEMQFYLIWGALTAGIYVCAEKFRRLRSCGKGLILFAAVILGVASYIHMQSGLNPSGENSRVYYDTLSHGYPLMIGSIAGVLFGLSPGRSVAAIMNKKAFRYPLYCLSILSFGGIAVFARLLFFTDAAIYRYGILSVSVMTALIIIGTRVLHKFAWIKEPGVIRLVGSASYSIYLLHWPVFIVVTQLLQKYAYRMPPEAREIGAGLLALGVTMILAWLSNRYIENILRGWKHETARYNRLIRRIAVSMAALMFIPSFAAVVSAPVITSIEASFMYKDNLLGGAETVEVFAAEAHTDPHEPPAAVTPAADEDPSADPAPDTAGDPSATTMPAAQDPLAAATPAVQAPTGTAAPAMANDPTGTATPAMTNDPNATATPAVAAELGEPEYLNDKYRSLKIPEGVLMIGDSVTLGCAGVLSPVLDAATDGAYIVNSAGSVHMALGLEIVQEYIDNEEFDNYKYIVIALATNTHPNAEESSDAMVELIGPEHEIIFVTGTGGPNKRKLAKYLRTFPDTYANVTVADWAQIIEPRSDQLSPDGIHAGTEVSKQLYAECVVDAIIAASADEP